MEQIELTFYVKGKCKPLTSLVFESKDSCKDFIDDMQRQDFIVTADYVINNKEIRYVKIRNV